MTKKYIITVNTPRGEIVSTPCTEEQVDSILSAAASRDVIHISLLSVNKVGSDIKVLLPAEIVKNSVFTIFEYEE